MKKINFTEQVLPHIVAIAIFLIVTFFFFSPVFFNNRSLLQGDIQQWEGSSKMLRDYRDQTGEEGLWAPTMFSGMPAYLINVKWGNTPVAYVKEFLSLFLPHPVRNIYLAFVCYYIMLLVFRVRPYLAIAGALAFGLSSYMIIGLMAGHNARIGAIAFTPLVMAGIHLVFTGRRIAGFGITAAGLSLHLLENHLQITYYFFMIVLVYGLIQLIAYIKEKRAVEFAKNLALLIPAALLAVGTFIGPLWGITEYTAFSIRGKSELVKPTDTKEVSGLSKEYAFEYSNGILEPFSLLVPNFYGASNNYLVQDQKSNVYTALTRSGNEQLANQLANYSSAYWGPQSYGLPYYAGAIIIFLFAVGIAFAEKKYIWWLLPLSIFAIVISWGSSFETFNYFLFEYLPGYNKFRSVTFALVIALFAMPLLGMLGLEKLFQRSVDKAARKRLVVAFASTGGLCLLVIIFAGVLSFLKEGEQELPPWFTHALAADRESLLRGDAFRSLIFITIVFAALYFEVWKKISPAIVYAAIIFLIVIDLSAVDKRYLTEDHYKRKRENTAFTPSEADLEIQKDKSYYRVYNLQGTLSEARTSYFHHSIGGYHGAKLRRYQDLFDSCVRRQTEQMITDIQAGRFEFGKFGVMNMLNVKYLVYGEQRANIIPNTAVNGPAWFVQEVAPVNSPTEELAKVCEINTHTTAVIDQSKFKTGAITYDSTSSLSISEHKPNYLKYESQSQSNALAVFSEIYYPKGWKAFIDGKEATVLRADYVLRALEIPAGKHTIEFKFLPEAYTVGNKITAASAWVTVLALFGCLGYSVRKKDEEGN